MKYSKEQLQSMAKTALHAKSIGDERYFQLIMALCVSRGCHPIDVENYIKELAK